MPTTSATDRGRPGAAPTAAAAPLCTTRRASNPCGEYLGRTGPARPSDSAGPAGSCPGRGTPPSSSWPGRRSDRR